MLTRTHVSSFVGLTAVAWLLALVAQGEPVLSLRFLRPFGLVTSLLVVVAALFERRAWAWRLFRGWYVSRPDLRGTWETMLVSDWHGPADERPPDSIQAFLVVRQTLTGLSARLITSESTSTTIAHSLAKSDDGVFRLAAVYRNEPLIALQGVRSEIHHGAFWLEVLEGPAGCIAGLTGHYWTDRKTRGTMNCKRRVSEVQSTYGDALRAFSTPSTVGR